MPTCRTVFKLHFSFNINYDNNVLKHTLWHRNVLSLENEHFFEILCYRAQRCFIVDVWVVYIGLIGIVGACPTKAYLVQCIKVVSDAGEISVLINAKKPLGLISSVTFHKENTLISNKINFNILFCHGSDRLTYISYISIVFHFQFILTIFP